MVRGEQRTNVVRTCPGDPCRWIRVLFETADLDVDTRAPGLSARLVDGHPRRPLRSAVSFIRLEDSTTLE